MSLPTFAGDSVRYYLDSYRYRRDRERERAYADSARVVLEGRLRGRPDDGKQLAFLGLAYASLGRAAEAVQTARRAVEVLPIERDANSGPFIVANLARVCMMVGQPERAIEQLEPFLNVPSWISPAELRADPTWAPLRDHPSFRRLLTKVPVRSRGTGVTRPR